MLGLFLESERIEQRVLRVAGYPTFSVSQKGALMILFIMGRSVKPRKWIPVSVNEEARRPKGTDAVPTGRTLNLGTEGASGNT